MPTVGIVMGSATDLDVMRAAAEALDEFGISREVRVISAHRAPADAARYAEEAAGRGLQVIIAGAGGAAHLPGVLAASTSLPVIGVPVPIKVLDGLDSLLSIVQMPAGIPVATVSHRRRPQRRPAGRAPPGGVGPGAAGADGRLPGQPGREEPGRRCQAQAEFG